MTNGERIKSMTDERFTQTNKEKYINSIVLNGVRYKLQCEIIAVNPIVCPKCGSSFVVNSDGVGRCDYCGTYYSAKYKLEEIK